MQNINRQSTYNYAAQLQEYICSALSASEWLQSLSVSFYPENSKDIEYQIKNALSRQGLACVVMTPRFSYIGHNGSNCAWDARDVTLNIAEFVPVNRASNKVSCVTGLDIANYVVEYLGGPQGAVSFGKFCPKGIEQREDGKLLVTNITFDCSTVGDLSGVFDWDEEQHGVVISPYALESDLNDLSANVLDLSAIVADISGHSELSDYYTKSETSSAVELKSTFNRYLPLSGGNVSGHLSIENDGQNSNFTLRNGQVSANVDIFPAWDSLDVGNTLYVEIDNGLGGKNYFNFPNKSGVIAVESDIDAAVSGKADLSALASKADISAIPTNVSQLSNDSGYITSADVKPAPAGVHRGFARNSVGTLAIYRRDPWSNQIDYNTYLTLQSTVSSTIPVLVDTTYDSWSLSAYNGTTFSTPIELKWNGYVTSYSVRIGRRTFYITVNAYIWKGSDANGDYIVKAEEDADGYIVPTDFGTRFDTARAVTWHTVTYNQAKTSILTIDGQADSISCSRPSTQQVVSHTEYLAYQSEVSSKADISALEAKADLSALNNYLPLSGGAVIQNDSPEGTTLVVQTNNPDGYSWLETKLTSDAGLAMYADRETRAVYIDRNYEQRFQSKNGVIALTSDIDSAVSAKADKSALTNYVPLSGNATISGDIAIDADNFSVTTPSCCLSVDGKKLVMWQTNLPAGYQDSSVISCAGEVHGRIGFFKGLGGLEQLQIQPAQYEEGQHQLASILECQTPWGSEAFAVKVQYDPDNFERILPRLMSYDGAYWYGFTLSSETMEMFVNTAEGYGKLKFPAKTGTLATTSDITQSLSSYLPLSGGSITGNVNISRGNLTLKDGTGYVTEFDIATRTGGDASIVQYYESNPETPITQLNLPTGKTGTLALMESIYTKYETISLSYSSTNKYQCDAHQLKTTKIDCSALTQDSTLHISFVQDGVYVGSAQYKYDIVVYNPNGCNLTLEFDSYLRNKIYSENGGASLNPGTNSCSFIEFRTLDDNIYFGKCTPLSVAY